MAGNGSTRREHGKHGAVGSPKVQLANLFASQHHRAAKFSVGALKFGHGLVRLDYQAAATPTAVTGTGGVISHNSTYGARRLAHIRWFPRNGFPRKTSKWTPSTRAVFRQRGQSSWVTANGNRDS